MVQAPGGASNLSRGQTGGVAFAGAGASSASATCRFRESIPHSVQPLSTLRTPRRRDARKTRSPEVSHGLEATGGVNIRLAGWNGGRRLPDKPATGCPFRSVSRRASRPMRGGTANYRICE